MQLLKYTVICHGSILTQEADYPSINERLGEPLIPPELAVYSSPQRMGGRGFCKDVNFIADRTQFSVLI